MTVSPTPPFSIQTIPEVGNHTDGKSLVWSTNRAYITGDYVNGGEITSVTKNHNSTSGNSNEQQINLALYQNYPNPFNIL